MAHPAYPALASYDTSTLPITILPNMQFVDHRALAIVSISVGEVDKPPMIIGVVGWQT